MKLLIYLELYQFQSIDYKFVRMEQIMAKTSKKKMPMEIIEVEFVYSTQQEMKTFSC